MQHISRIKQTNLVPGCNENPQTWQREEHAGKAGEMVLGHIDPCNEVSRKVAVALQ